jgi:hypothetical protein
MLPQLINGHVGRFMWNLHAANAEHWVPISTVASFKRMHTYSDLGIPWVATALRTCSEDLEVDEKGENVRRKHEVQEPKDAWARSVYAVRLILSVWQVITSLRPSLGRLEERVRARRARVASKAGRVFRQVREDQCGEDEED